MFPPARSPLPARLSPSHSFGRTMDPFDAAQIATAPTGAALAESALQCDAMPAISNAQAFLQAPDHQAAVRTLVEELVAAFTLAREQAEQAEQRARSARVAASRYKTESKANETVWRRRKAHWDTERQKHRRLCEKYEGLLNKVKTEAALRRSNMPIVSGCEPRTHGSFESSNFVDPPLQPGARLQQAPPTTLAQVHGGGKTGRTNPMKSDHNTLPHTMESSIEMELPVPPPAALPLPEVADIPPSGPHTDAPHKIAAAQRRREASRSVPKQPSKALSKKCSPMALLHLAGGDLPTRSATPRPKPAGQESSRPAVYHQVVRGHARARLPPRPCKECDAFFAAVGMNAGFCSDACRHRYEHPRRETPDGFWSFDQSGF